MEAYSGNNVLYTQKHPHYSVTFPSDSNCMVAIALLEMKDFENIQILKIKSYGKGQLGKVLERTYDVPDLFWDELYIFAVSA